ncbi:hypothetical protein DRQ11_13475 [candidate division KSB1 bacterium]|nr:MAG: hypothetical protein DRQ11_13475 [candidate division KSB1 bacterium]
MNHMVHICLGNGIGAGIFINGRMYRGGWGVLVNWDILLSMKMVLCADVVTGDAWKPWPRAGR